MPWTKRSTILDELAERLKDEAGRDNQPMSTLQILLLLQLMIEQIRTAVRAIAILVMVLFIVVGGMTLLISQTKDTTKNVKDILTLALDPNQPASKQGQDAIVRIKRMEHVLCGGPCPTLPEENK